MMATWIFPGGHFLEVRVRKNALTKILIKLIFRMLYFDVFYGGWDAEQARRIDKLLTAAVGLVLTSGFVFPTLIFKCLFAGKLTSVRN